MKREALAAQVIDKARACRVTIVTAESCTAGAVGKALSEAPGAGKYLQGGFITYTKEMKHAALGVSNALLKEKTAVCAEVAEAMALGALKQSPASVAVAVTGVAGPEPDEDGNPVGLVYCCAAGGQGEPLIARRQFEGMSRDEVIDAAVRECLLLLQRLCETIDTREMLNQH
jgi:nicotinamide-nucleotide amidase